MYHLLCLLSRNILSIDPHYILAKVIKFEIFIMSQPSKHRPSLHFSKSKKIRSIYHVCFIPKHRLSLYFRKNKEIRIFLKLAQPAQPNPCLKRRSISSLQSCMLSTFPNGKLGGADRFLITTIVFSQVPTNYYGTTLIWRSSDVTIKMKNHQIQ